MDLISDIAFNSSFPENELKKEKEIILDEINSYKDSPSDLIFDEFEELLYDGNPIARNILGNAKKLKHFNGTHIRQFINRNYSTDQMIVSSVGNIEFRKLIRLFEKYFNTQALKKSNGRAPAAYGNESFHRNVNRKTFQAHCVIGNVAYPFDHPNRLALYLLNNYLGGPGMNSRLNLALRERKGYAYSVDSQFTSYSDTGNITIYFGTDKTLVDKCTQLVLDEVKGVMTKSLSTSRLHKAKKQVHGHIAISSENNENHMLSIGKSLLIFNKIESIEEIGKKVEALTSSDLLQVANEVLDPSRLSYLIYQ